MFKRTVNQKSQNLRLDTYLYISGCGVSRTRIKKAIEEGNVLVNGRRVKPSYKVKAGDEILAKIEIEEIPDIIIAENRSVDIVYEDEDIIVINKRAGEVVHPAKGHFTGTIVNALYHKLLNAPGSERKRPGIVHRLDKDTSGLMVIGKSEKAVRDLARQMATKEAQRTYLAFVWGRIETSGMIEAPIGRHPIDRKRMAITVINSKTAITEYEPMVIFDFITLLKVKLKTGRTHQIRVHMEYIGHPIVGDPTYSGREPTKIINAIGSKVPFERILNAIDRQALHAWRLKIRHPTKNVVMEFLSPLPKDMADLIKEIKLLSGSSDNSP